jgi:ABC-type transport system involved in cytochrome c biogenesis ATPase subunit
MIRLIGPGGAGKSTVGIMALSSGFMTYPQQIDSGYDAVRNVASWLGHSRGHHREKKR